MREKVWGYLALIFSLISIGAMNFLWHREISTYVPHPGQLVDSAAVESYLRADAATADVTERRVYVPTGVFIQSLAFTSASDVNVTGYIWQKHSDAVPADISRSFVFPEQINSNDTVIEEAYRRKYRNGDESGKVIGWYFDVTLRQPFDYSKYPLDKLY